MRKGRSINVRKSGPIRVGDDLIPSQSTHSHSRIILSSGGYKATINLISKTGPASVSQVYLAVTARAELVQTLIRSTC